MGNITSTNQFSHYDTGQVSVATQEDQYWPGETVRAYVNLNFDTPQKANDLSIKFSGVMKTMVPFTSEEASLAEGEFTNHSEDGDTPSPIFVGEFTDGLTTTKHFHARMEQSIFDQQTTLATYPGGIVPLGLHQIPFEFVLPYSIPSSCSIRDFKYGATSTVLYTISVLFRRPTEATHHVALVVPVDVTAVAAAAKLTFFRDHERVVRFCCLDSGEISLSARLVTRSYYPGNPVHLEYEVTNASSAEVDYIEAVVERFSQWSARGHTHTSKEVVQRVRILDSPKDQYGRRLSPAIPRSNRKGSNSFASTAKFNLKVSGAIPTVTTNILSMSTTYTIIVTAHTTRKTSILASVRLPIKVRKLPPRMEYYTKQVATTFFTGAPPVFPFALSVAYEPPAAWWSPALGPAGNTTRNAVKWEGMTNDYGAGDGLTSAVAYNRASYDDTEDTRQYFQVEVRHAGVRAPNPAPYDVNAHNSYLATDDSYQTRYEQLKPPREQAMNQPTPAMGLPPRHQMETTTSSSST
mmetsp:Transcript_34961/g.76442  ORF Transcript_34961/g.76442 Transcript_34961/m.76442 type:complete len:521 (-) Transcript_34961:127-1689(-)